MPKPHEYIKYLKKFFLGTKKNIYISIFDYSFFIHNAYKNFGYRL